MNDKLPNMNKPSDLSGIPFRLDPRSIADGKANFREEYQTGYAYHMAMKAQGKKAEALIGYWNNDKFLTRPKFKPTAQYTETDWDAFEFIDTENNGKQKNYFEQKYVGIVRFDGDANIPVWDSDAKSLLDVETPGAWLTMSSSQYEKMCKVLHDKRSKASDFVMMTFNRRAAPADMYTFEWHEEFTGTDDPLVSAAKPAATAAEVIDLTREEFNALSDIVGIDATVQSVVDYLRQHNETKSITTTRATQVANFVLLDDIVTLPTA